MHDEFMGIEYGPLPPNPLKREEVLPWIEVAQSARLNAEVLPHLMPPKEGSFLRPNADDPLKNMAWFCHGPASPRRRRLSDARGTLLPLRSVSA